MIYQDSSKPVSERVKNLMEQMTLKEKLAQIGSYWVYQLNNGNELCKEKADALLSQGIGQITRVSGGSGMRPAQAARFANQVQRYLLEHTRLGIPAIIHEEACSGFTAVGAAVFPQAIGVAATFDSECARSMGEAIRRHMCASGARQALAPLLDITRDPRWGRTEETFGEDPCVVSDMGSAFIQGLQGELSDGGVIATGKHFVGYGASEGGMNWAPAHIPERELREVYLAPFEAAVRQAGLLSIMNGYHELDGIPCAASKELLNDTLRGKWGFDGIVVSDYFAVNQLYDYHRMAGDKAEAAKVALEAGMDVELPNVDCFGEPLEKAVEAGKIDISLVDCALERVLRMKFLLGLFEKPFVEEEKTESCFDTAEDRRLAEEIASKSLVLLKNEGILPLSKEIPSIAVLGPSSNDGRLLMGDYTYQGQIEGLIELYESGASNLGQPIPESVDMFDNIVPIPTFLQAIRKALPETANILWEQGCGVKQGGDGMDRAVRAAKSADVAVLFLGDKAGITAQCTVGESVDRAELKLPGEQMKLFDAVCETGTPVVVVLTTGRPYALGDISQRAAAVLQAWLPGEEGAAAVASVLFGDTAPGGKLPISFPRSSGQIPVYYRHKKSGGRSHWRGSYDDMSASPLYPFGHGLSYTTFEYSGFRLDRTEMDSRGEFTASVTVTNTGCRSGDEVVQLYTRDEAACVTRPVKELRGYRRITLEPGQAKTVSFTVKAAQLNFYGADMQCIVEPGETIVMIGASSEDIRCEGTLMITGETVNVEQNKSFFPSITVR